LSGLISDIDWLNSFVGEATSSSIANSSDCVAADAGVSAPDKPWSPPFPSLEDVAAMRLQFFDNGSKPGRGKSQHVLKVRAFLNDSKPINQKNPDWERCIQLIDAQKVIAWADGEQMQGKISGDVLRRYYDAARSCQDWMAEPDAEWAKMGHVASQPGTVYFHDQFVAVCRKDSGLNATLYIDGATIEIEKFYPNTAGSRTGAPKMHALYDPQGLIDKRRSK